jgi:predicted ATPase
MGSCHQSVVIASVAFRNFKALRHTELSLLPFNLVIGPNGSGKTSLIQAILRLRTLAKLPLGTPPAEPKLREGGPEMEFHFIPPHEGITARLVCVSENVCDLLTLTPRDASGWPELKTRIGGIRAFLLDHYAMSLPARRSEGAELAGNGGNLAAVLATLKEAHPEVFARLSAELTRIAPEFSDVVFIDHADDTVELALRMEDEPQPVTAENLSQGTLYLLAMLALAFSPAPPAVVCIEEIDRGIHPRMLRELRDLLYRLSYPAEFGESRAPVQVIATTHSPYLLDLFRDHPEEVVIAQKHGREAKFERLSDRADLPELLAEGTLGDMWFSGILGGVPDEP